MIVTAPDHQPLDPLPDQSHSDRVNHGVSIVGVKRGKGNEDDGGGCGGAHDTQTEGGFKL